MVHIVVKHDPRAVVQEQRWTTSCSGEEPPATLTFTMSVSRDETSWLPQPAAEELSPRDR
jgi:hypothetical protein